MVLQWAYQCPFVADFDTRVANNKNVTFRVTGRSALACKLWFSDGYSQRLPLCPRSLTTDVYFCRRRSFYHRRGNCSVFSLNTPITKIKQTRTTVLYTVILIPSKLLKKTPVPVLITCNEKVLTLFYFQIRRFPLKLDFDVFDAELLSKLFS